MLDLGFQVGDEVITSELIKGTIISICECDQCKSRGFYEPTIKLENGEVIYLSNYGAFNGFKDFYKIGKVTFGNVVPIEELVDNLTLCLGNMVDMCSQLSTLLKSIQRIKEFKKNEI